MLCGTYARSMGSRTQARPSVFHDRACTHTHHLFLKPPSHFPTLALAHTHITRTPCCSGFFGASLASQLPGGALGMAPADLAAIGVVAGGVAEVAARSTRYSLLEPSKEMKYMQARI